MQERCFNVEGACNPEEHYMVNLDKRIEKIKQLVDSKKYFSINRGRQYGKTTTLDLLQEKLAEEYSVFYISFEGLAEESYQNENAFCRSFVGLLYDAVNFGEVKGISDAGQNILESMSKSDAEYVSFRSLSNSISEICATAQKPVVLIIDEVDQAGNRQSFLTFLGMLRNKYLKRKQRPTFQSVILAGVYDIRNLKLKIRGETEHQKNSPWNIAADFDIEMSLDYAGIRGMLIDYEQDYHTGMNVDEMADLLYSYTSGYPFLVSRLCQLLDEKITGTSDFSDKSAAWTKKGFLKAVKILLLEKNTLFESLVNKLDDYPELRKMFYAMLFTGDRITYNPDSSVIDLAAMLGFVKNERGMLMIANRIFEVRLYNLFLSEMEMNNLIFSAGTADKNQFIEDGDLNMDLVLKKFMIHWNELYSSADERFVEDNGRKFFLLYLKPIINGAGNYYIESQTRDRKRTDIIVDYRGKQYIIEVKIWHGDEYNRRGERQLADYLEAYHTNKGYLLSFNFNKNKVTGVKTVMCGDKEILEAVV